MEIFRRCATLRNRCQSAGSRRPGRREPAPRSPGARNHGACITVAAYRRLVLQ